VTRLSGRRERDGPCSGSLRPWVVAAAAGKKEKDSAGVLGRAGRRKGVLETPGVSLLEFLSALVS